MKILILSFLFPFFLFANTNFVNMKKCEKIQLSKYTSLISCHKLDYLIEYKFVDDEEKDNIKKITVISTEDKKIILKNMDK